ncbi:hypothetical protein N172_16215 [Pantoea dispersa EGD-AAK13]|nr:hypothetical protein N172_16215 [Pantoea dispersa EGD-AAK13]
MVQEKKIKTALIHDITLQPASLKNPRTLRD